MIITNSILDGIVIILLLQLLCFHVYLQIKGLSTYDFLMKGKVKPITQLVIPSKSSVKEVDEVAPEQEEAKNHQEIPQRKATQRKSELPILNDPKKTSYTNLGLTFPKNNSEVEILRHPLSHQPTQRAEPSQQIGKESIFKQKQRRSGSDIKPPR